MNDQPIQEKTEILKEITSESDCFSLFFNLIISQLFIGSISSLIDFIRIFFINLLRNAFQNKERFQKNEIYLQPIITSLILLILGIIFYNLFNVVKHKIFSILGLILIFLIVVIFIIICSYTFFYYIKQKKLNKIYKKIQK